MILCEQTDEYFLDVCCSDDTGKMQKRKIEKEKDNGTADILKTKGEITLEVCMVFFPIICSP